MYRGVALQLFPFTFPSACSSLDPFGIDHTNHDSFSESEKNNPAEANASANSILLPSEKPEFEPATATLIQWEPHEETRDSKISKPEEAETVESMEMSITESSKASNPVHFPVISFRPINNRRIPRHPLPLSFRRGHRRCHHIHNRHRFEPRNPRLPHREMPYGNDLNLNKVEDKKNLDPLARGGVRQIPARWIRFRSESMFSHEPSLARSELTRGLYRHRRHYHHHHHHEPENKKIGLMKRIRRFLNRF